MFEKSRCNEWQKGSLQVSVLFIVLNEERNHGHFSLLTNFVEMSSLVLTIFAWYNPVQYARLERQI